MKPWVSPPILCHRPNELSNYTAETWGHKNVQFLDNSCPVYSIASGSQQWVKHKESYLRKYGGRATDADVDVGARIRLRNSWMYTFKCVENNNSISRKSLCFALFTVIYEFATLKTQNTTKSRKTKNSVGSALKKTSSYRSLDLLTRFFRTQCCFEMNSTYINASK